MKDFMKVAIIALVGRVAYFAQDGIEVVEAMLGGSSIAYTVAFCAVAAVVGLRFGGKESATNSVSYAAEKPVIRASGAALDDSECSAIDHFDFITYYSDL